MLDFFEDYEKELFATMNALDKIKINDLYLLMNQAYENGKKIYILGNGGSASTASHWICDFGKGINTPKSKRMKMISLVDNVAILTALGNDVSYDDTFSEQLKNFLEEGDLVISLSVSGNSLNLVAAHKYAKSVGAHAVAIIGDYDGLLNEYSDSVLLISSKNYGIVEDIHLILNHIISQYMTHKNKLSEQVSV